MVSTRRSVHQMDPTAEEQDGRPVAKKAKLSGEDASTGGDGLSKSDDATHSPKKRKTKQKEATEEPNPADYPTRAESPWKVGLHVSVAGGVENAITKAAELGANAFALFLKGHRAWSSPPLREESITKFKSRLAAFGYAPRHVLPHGNYLINIGNPDDEKREKAYECFLDDMKRCEQLGLELYNFHPGSTVGETTTEHSISLIALCINRAHKETRTVVTVIENMAGAGNVIGSTFSDIARIIRDVEDKTRVGVCLDTCHMFAAGYDIRTPEGWEETMADFDAQVGFKYLRGIHMNDSKAELGSRKDRHENIGLGHLDLDTFHHILTSPHTRDLPLILETPGFATTDVAKKEIEVLNRVSSWEYAKVEAQGESVVAEVRAAVEKAAKETKAKEKEKPNGKKKRSKRKQASEKDAEGADADD